MPIELVIMLVMGFAMFVQGAAGFGSALIAMPLLISLLGLKVAAPSFALIAQTAGVMTLWHYRQHFSVREVWRVLLASLLAIPFSITLAHSLDEHVALGLLGTVIVVYAVYGLWGRGLPPFTNPRWGYVFGIANGLLHGAYNTGGPPLVMYGTAMRWPPAVFKAHLQTIFFLNGLLVIATHAVNGRMTPLVWHYYLVMLCPVFVGLILGQRLDGVINPVVFRRGVLVLLLVIGVTLIF